MFRWAHSTEAVERDFTAARHLEAAGHAHIAEAGPAMHARESGQQRTCCGRERCIAKQLGDFPTVDRNELERTPRQETRNRWTGNDRDPAAALRAKTLHGRPEAEEVTQGAREQYQRIGHTGKVELTWR